MKNILTLITLAILTFSCGSDDGSEFEKEIPDITYLENIAEFSVAITTPELERDYTYHNQGSKGIFEDSNSKTTFNGQVKLKYKNNSIPVPPNEINVMWYSKLDGTIFEGKLSDNYQSSFEKELSTGVHKIYFEASLGSKPDLIVTDSVVLASVMSLKAEPTDRSVKLSWTKYEGNDFQSYLLYGEDFEPIEEILDINTLHYEVNTFTLAELNKFQIVVKTLNDGGEVTGSNIEEEAAGDYIEIPHFITKTIYDRSRDKLYATVGDKYDGEDNANEYGLIILSDNTEGVEVESHILKEYRISDLDISLDEKYLFLSQRYVDQIIRLDLNTLEFAKIPVPAKGLGIHKIEVGMENYRLYCVTTPSASEWSNLFEIDGISGEGVGFYNWMGRGDLEYNIHNNKLYHNGTTSADWLIKFHLEYTGVMLEKMFQSDVNWPTSYILLSESGEHIFWEKFHLDKDLNVIRKLENPITACDRSETYVSDGQKLMTFNDLTTVLNYPEFREYDLNNELFTDDNTLVFIKSKQLSTDRRYTQFFKLRIE